MSDQSVRDDPYSPENFRRCPYCGETIWQNHRDCLLKALRERDEACNAAREIVKTVCALLPHNVRATVLRRVTAKWPWIVEEEAE